MESRSPKKFYDHLPKKRLIGYCELHCKTEVALFPKEIIAQMIEYAGRPKNFPLPEEVMKGIKSWYQLWDEMEELVNLSKRKSLIHLAVNNTKNK